MSRSPALARRFFDRFEPVHAVAYFAPEARRAMDELGLRGFWMGYFAARSAPLGRAPAEVVTATFHNFARWRVTAALDAAWQRTTPGQAVQARSDGAVAALRRCGLDEHQSLSATAELAAKAALGAALDGRPLFAAHAALPWPEEPLARLWHATTLLREHRGDGHVAVLTANGISGREANVLHCLSGAVSEHFIRRARDYDDQEWAACRSALAARGLVAGEELSPAGRRLKDDIEAATDRLALDALTALDDAEVEALFAGLTPLTRLVVAGGDVPESTPMGLRRDELDDNSSGLC
ncbi:hypothetical protein BCA37_18520 [Mycobacterium sp. djl-10]|nr:hypothetical protein BCA37_18520 [Mycobacterium sp. djl-10]